MIVHLQGRLVPAAEARVSVFDRGFLFGDGLYEGLRATGGRIIALDDHVARMARGLEEMRIDGYDPARMGADSGALLDANGLADAFVYWQVTRGTPPPDAPVRERVPAAAFEPTVLGFASPTLPVAACTEPATLCAALRPDTRWTRGHLKAITLLGSVLAVLEAREAHADDAILHRDGWVTEGSATNVVVAVGGRLVTPALERGALLPGVTRKLLLAAAPEIEERRVAVEELAAADEILLIGTRTMVASVVVLDGRPVGDGRPGPAARRLLALLRDAALQTVHSLHA